MAPLAACVQLTDFDRGDDDGSSSGDSSSSPTGDTSHSDTGVEPTDGDATDAEDSGPGVACGNGMIDPEEECDDANQTNGDGCQTDCTVTGGETIWTVEDPRRDAALSVVALPDGGFVIGTGSSVVRFDADGQQVWVHTDLLEQQWLGDLALSADGDVLVVGTVPIEIKFAIGEVWVAELSVDDGSEQWSALPGIPLVSTWGRRIAVDSEGALRIAGFSGGEGASFVLVAGLAADGTLEWWDQIDEISSGYAEATDVTVLPDGSAVFVGWSEYDPDHSTWARRVDATGQELWTTGFSDVGGVDASIDRRVDGTLLLMAESIGTTVVELDEDGGEQRRYTWKRDDVTHHGILDTATAGDGTLYLAGSSIEPDGGLYGALDASGGHLWSHLFTGGDPADGYARDVAILSDGSVIFVGGVDGTPGDAYLWMRKTGP